MHQECAFSAANLPRDGKVAAGSPIGGSVAVDELVALGSIGPSAPG
jgi:hypothetical protein